MKRRAPAKAALFLWITVLARMAFGAEVPLPPATIVVYNSATPESGELAKFLKCDDILRVVLEEADALIKQNNSKRAVELIRSVLRISADAPAAPLLKKLEAEARTATPRSRRPIPVDRSE